MNKTHIDRLQKLKAFLSTLDPAKFSHANTASIPYTGFKVTPDINLPGATADALGHAAMMQDFRRAGLAIEWGDKVHHCSRHAFVRFGQAEDEAAGAAFFGLTAEEACYLFVPGNGPDHIGTSSIKLADYCKRLDKFINTKVA